MLQLPLLEIVPLESEADATLIRHNQQLLNSVGDYSALIFISTNAVAAWREMAGARASTAPGCFAVGAATAAAAAAAGCKVLGAGTNSETLLALPAMQGLSGKVMIVRGVGGRELLASALRSRGVTVDYLDAYRRRPTAIDPSEFVAVISDAGCNAICAYSGETVAALDRLLTAAGAAKLRGIPLVVPGARVADIATAAGFSRVSAADSAAPESMLEAIAGVEALDFSHEL